MSRSTTTDADRVLHFYIDFLLFSCYNILSYFFFPKIGFLSKIDICILSKGCTAWVNLLKLTSNLRTSLPNSVSPKTGNLTDAAHPRNLKILGLWTVQLRRDARSPTQWWESRNKTTATLESWLINYKQAGNCIVLKNTHKKPLGPKERQYPAMITSGDDHSHTVIR